ncbi:MAG: helix-turn-helix domain-containing protein [Mycobacterium sp.]|uniref:helix-turn-helix transcriptional regulator n=1 Tax=Mycobacterium sp. TaxID=1785 RepID=UPI0026384EAF|nr:helix-turn-helix domain-containing protein [Mycobacterium sp.]MDI3315188.1 helix-turn-helix domain-containing protein [Mycobacterium sp.]
MTDRHYIEGVKIGAGADLDAVARLSSLADPLRRRLYEYVASRDEPVARDDVAAAAGISHKLAAYHLDKLADAGILTVSYARPPGRSGPGAGRPAKRYLRAQQELLAGVPPRNYGLLAELLADAIAAGDSDSVRDAVAVAAQRAGRATRAGRGVLAALRGCGYEPVETPDGGIELRNCPFGSLAREHTELVCGLNLQLIRGILEAVGDQPDRAALAPRNGRCCVVVRAPGHPRAPGRPRKKPPRRAARVPRSAD